MSLTLSPCDERQGKGMYTCKASGGKYDGEYKNDKKVGGALKSVMVLIYDNRRERGSMNGATETGMKVNGNL